MTVRLGIELTPTACRIVEVGRPGSRRSGDAETRVARFAVIGPEGPQLAAGLQPMRRRGASIVIWGVGADHRVVTVASGEVERIREEARAATEADGLDMRGVLFDVAPAAPAPGPGGRRAVVIAMADRRAVRAAVAPIIAAGIRVLEIATPASALLSLARTRRGLAPPGALEAYVALEETAAAVALVRDSTLVGATELTWGYLEQPAGGTRTREEIAGRLANELERFFEVSSHRVGPVTQVCICGGAPDLRSTAVPLMERLDVEVETLDSLVAIDAAALPEPSDQFRERIAELRLAWAVAADPDPPLNLLWGDERRAARARFSRAAVAAGVLVGFGAGWQIAHSAWWGPASRPAPASRVARGVDTPRRLEPASPRTATPSPGPYVAAGSVRSAPLTPAPVTPAPMAQVPALPPPLTVPPVTPKVVALPAGPTPTPAAVLSTAPLIAAVRPMAEAPPSLQPPPAEPRAAAARPATVQAEPRGTPLEPLRARSGGGGPVEPAVRASLPGPISPPRGAEPQGRRAQAAKPDPSPLPFEAALGSILYGPDRRLAVVDGRIVESGDEVRGARIVEITPTGVLLRDGQGRLRRLALGGAGR